MSTKNTPKKNGDLIRTSSQQEEIEDDVLLTQVHKLQFDRPGSSRAETTRLQEEEVAQSYERPARRMLPDEPRDSVKDEKISDGDDSFSLLSSQDQDYFGDMLSSQVSIVLTGAEVTLDESSEIQNALTTPVVGDSNDNDIAASNWPTAMADRLSVLVSESPIESARSGFDGVTGQPLVEMDSSAAVQSLTLTNAAGQALNGEDSGLLTLSGQSIFLFTDTQDPNLVLGKTDTGQVVMAVYLSPTGPDLHAADVWTVLYQPLQHPDANMADEAVNLAGKLFVTAETSGGSNMLASGPSGQNLFLMLGNHDEAVVVSGVHPANQSQGISLNQGDTVNSSQAYEHLAIGTNNQMVDGPGVNKSGGVTQGGEGLVITYVTGAHDDYTSLQLSPTEADVEANIQFDGLKESTHAIVGVSQLQPVKAATVKITALLTGYEPGVQFVDGLLTNDTAVGITRVVVMDAQHNVLEDSNGSVNSASISISFSGGSATVSGITAGHLIAFDTVAVHNRVLIENPGNANPYLSSSFDLGYFSWGESESTTLDIGSAVRFEDAAPSADENLVVQLDDDALAGGIAGGDGDVNPDVQNVTGTLGYSYGADGGSMTWLDSGAPDGFSYVVDGNQLFIEQGETTVMTLTLNTTTGAYLVEQNAPLMHPEGLNENNQNFSVTYQVTDGDGDTAAGQLAITVNDDTPTVSENLMVIFDDDALAGGNPNGVGDLSPDTENATGTLGYSYGADGGSITWLTTGSPDGFTYVVDGNQLFIEQGETTVMTLTLDTTAGTYTVEQNAPLMHPEGLNENNQNFNVTYQITDSDGDTAAGQLAITVNDDSPTVSENQMVIIDDDALAGGNPDGVNDLSPDTENATGTLGYSYGADGGSVTWLTTGSPDGFTYVADGSQLFIEQGETTVMTLTLNTATGSYTVEQNAPLMHPEGLNENNQNFNVTYQVTDIDGDTAAGQLAITVNDDTPTVSENLMVILDDDALPNGNPGGVNDLSPDTENATGILGYSHGADGGSMTWLDSGAPDGFTYVADGNQLFIQQGETTVMTLTLDTTTGAYTVEQNAPLMHPEGLNENNQNFNVTYQVTDGDGDTAAGQLAITVNDDTPTVSENLMVIFDDDALAGGNPAGVNDLSPDTENATGALGYSYGADGGSMTWLDSGAPDGFTYVVDGNQLFIEQGETTVMTLTMNTTTGAYTVEQNAPLMHPEGLNENNQNFNVTYQITDSDGDTAAGQLAITVNDDSPTVSENLMVVLDDDALAGGNPNGVDDIAPDTQNATGSLGYSYGADGGSMTWLDSGAPDGFTYVVDGNQLFIEQGETTVMTLTLDTTTGAYTVEQNAPLMHPEGLNENNQNFNVTYQITDSDGDTAAGQLAITVNDDTPTVSENQMVIIDDDALAGGNPNGVGDLSPDTENATGTLGYSYGADGGSMTWLTTGSPDGFTYVVDGNQLFIEQGETTVMTLTLNTTTGAYSVEQNAPLMHPEGLNENNQNFNVTYQVTDGDGDTAAGQLAITVNDDTPTVSENLMVILDDDALPNGNPGGVNDLSPDTENATGTLGYSYGADGGSITWLTTGSPDGFTYVVDGNQLFIEQGETTVMTLTLDTTTGAYTVEQNAPLMHPEGLNENNQNFNVTYQVTDSDGDTAAGQLAITVNDDTPTVSENLVVHLDDNAMPGANPVGNEGIPPDIQNTTGTLSHSYGADGGAITWITTGSPEGFVYQSDGNNLLIRQGEVTVITLSLDTATGEYLTVQHVAIMNEPIPGENSQDFQVHYSVTDSDGDISTGQLAITVKDDIPHGSFNEINLLDDDALAGGNPGGIGDVAPDTAFATGNLDFAFGADGGSIAWLTTGAPDGFSYEADGTSLLVKQAGTLVLTLTLDPVSAAYTVVQNSAIQHVSGLDENSQAFTMNYNVLDNDGDSAIGQFYVTVNDDTATVGENLMVHLDDDALPGGNPVGNEGIPPDVQNTSGTLAHSYGADGGTIAWATTGAPDGFSYQADGSSLLIRQGDTTVITLSLDTATGDYLATQNAALINVSGLGENNQDFQVYYNVTDGDGDITTGQLAITVNDDTPHGSFNEVNLLDDDALAGGNPGGIGDVVPDTAFATGNLDFAFGADGGSIAWLTTGAPDGFTYEADGTSLLVKQAGTLVLTLTLDPVSAAYTVVQNSAIQHVSGLDENSQAFTMNYNVLDNDGDPAIGQFYITVNDDTPVVTQVNDVWFQNTDNPVPGGDSQFDYSIGADKRSTFSNVDSDFSMFSLKGEVGINSITNTHITWYAEDTTSAVFRFDFDYQPNEASPSTAHAMGTLMFDKAEGTYHINLDQYIQGFNILTTSSALSITGYEANSTQVDKTQPAVSVAQLSDGAYVQFTSASESGGGTGDNNLQVNGVDGDSSHWAAGELFSQSAGWVSISNLSNGVNGDTMQKGEVLNLSLFDFNPYGNLNASPNAGASGMFLKLDGIGSEDLVVVLKLVDTETLEDTTRALIIDNSDILKLGNVLTPDYHIVLDNNDGAVIIESNDFNGVGEHFVMTGAQILTSTEGITGSALNFNSQTGVSGASTTAQDFDSTTTDGDVIKISDIGIMTNQTSTLDSHLEFKFAIKDADLDATPTQTLNAYIAGSDVNPLATLM